MFRMLNVIRTTPICVLITITSIVLTYHLQVMYDHELDHNFTLCPTAVLLRLQIHRLITSPFLHSSIVHMSMSILTLFSLGTFLEYRFGTLWLFSVIAMSAILVSAMYTLLTFVLFFSGINNKIVDHTFGFSKVAFHLLVIECHRSFKPFSVFGICEVNPKLYPWVSLLVTQLILQHVSFVGHLSGILVGYLHVTGFLERFLPSVQNLRSLDERSYMKYYQIYIRTSSADELYSNTCFQDTISCFNQFRNQQVGRDLIGNCKKMKKGKHSSKKRGNNAAEVNWKESRKEKLSSGSLDILDSTPLSEEQALRNSIMDQVDIVL